MPNVWSLTLKAAKLCLSHALPHGIPQPMNGNAALLEAASPKQLPSAIARSHTGGAGRGVCPCRERAHTLTTPANRHRLPSIRTGNRNSAPGGKRTPTPQQKQASLPPRAALRVRAEWRRRPRARAGNPLLTARPPAVARGWSRGRGRQAGLGSLAILPFHCVRPGRRLLALQIPERSSESSQTAPAGRGRGGEEGTARNPTPSCSPSPGRAHSTPGRAPVPRPVRARAPPGPQAAAAFRPALGQAPTGDDLSCPNSACRVPCRKPPTLQPSEEGKVCTRD